MAHDHSQGGASAGMAGDAHAGRQANEKRLLIAIGLTGTFMIAEIIGGFVFNSLALLSDAAHMMTDVMALIIAFIAIQIGKKAADSKRTFGYRRFEVLAAVFNAIVLFAVAIYILYEAYERFNQPPEVQTGGMLIVAVLGLIVNLVSMRVLQGGSDESLNMKGAYLEVLADMLGSLGVIIAAVLIYVTKIPQIDPILAVLIGFWVLPRTWKLLKESFHVLLEGVPAGVDLQKVESELAAVAGVKDVHDLHIWSVTTGENSLTAHLLVNPGADEALILARAHEIAATFGIAHATVQVERTHVGIETPTWSKDTDT
ncbi:cation diffusion facilitator family transporter [Asticcacaulis excentricus]|uniref:Cation diffusion facilitator family transporter n=1 Tax=Asticcacaulis excentricus (strain ATCC 15261 / DSM 4724 / KCTC 12464 / NCIMB 9791 / VKM B-1370 / CB 48) TaxID=573065 RepID=E8RW40_ASTEC|nr:cation diffusion facilitator family transporter [Asticcacaulis excentricus]ADU15462.1 cation diffusion facilitator family transporter [Asticcacaulis excentricus CB 48]